MFRERIRELLERAGLGRVPTPVLGAALVVCVLVAAASWIRSPASAAGSIVVSADPPVAAEESTEPASEEPTPAEVAEPVNVVVHVVGAVLRPGVYEVQEGSRVADVVARAGGLTGDAQESAVNLARVVTDGEQVNVPTQDEVAQGVVADRPDEAVSASVPAASAPGGPVNVNTADAALLETLPGVGPVTAAEIIADREANGPFASVDDLLRVSGIGDKRLEALRGLVVVR
jgi:competence protein ComEA